MLGFEGSPRAIIGSKVEEFQAPLLAKDWMVCKYCFDLDLGSPRIVACCGGGTAACQELEEPKGLRSHGTAPSLLLAWTWILPRHLFGFGPGIPSTVVSWGGGGLQALLVF